MVPVRLTGNAVGVLFILTIAFKSCCTSKLIVYPMIVEGKSDSEEDKTLFIRKGLVLNLQPAKVLSRDLVVTTLENGVRSEQIIDSRIIHNQLYKDPENGASLIVRDSGDDLDVHGIVNSEWGIRPLVAEERTLYGPRGHKLFRISERSGKQKRAVSEAKTVQGQRHDIVRQRSDADGLPSEVNLEVHVVGDQKHVEGYQRYEKETNLSYTAYVAVLLNGANLIFESTAKPRIQIYLTGVTMISNGTADILDMQGSYADGRKTLENKFKEFVEQNITGTPNMIYLLTGLDVNGTYRGMNYSIYARGEAIQSGLCNYTENTAIGEDGPGSFAGYDTMAHMLSVLMGATPNGTTVYPNGTQCNVPDAFYYTPGFFLDLDFPEKKYMLTNCTQASIRTVLTERGASCWNKSLDFIETPDLLSGDVISETKFCHRLEMYYNRTLDPCATVKEKQRCLLRCCDNRSAVNKKVLRLAPDRMSCRDNLYCYKGKCVESPPRYTGRKAPATTRPPRR